MRTGRLPGWLVRLVALVWAVPALAADPVGLPEGQDPAVWVEPLRLADLAPGARGAGAWVELEDRGHTWVLRVRDASGRVQEVRVPPPTTPQEREDLAWLARSLLKPASGASWRDVDTLATVPASVPPPAPPRAAAAKASTPPPAAAPALAAPPVVGTSPATTAAEPAALAPPAPVAPPPAAGGGLPLWVEVGGAAAWRADSPLGGAVRVGGGAAVGAWRVGVAAEFSPERALPALGEARGVRAADLSAGATFHPAALPAVGAGVRVGAALRSFRQGGVAIDDVVIPFAAGELSARIPVGGTMALVPYAEARGDLRVTELRIGAAPGGVGSLLELRGGLLVEWRKIP